MISLAFYSFIHYFKCRCRTNKFLPFTTTRDVGDSEEGAKPIEMLGDSLGVWFVVELSIAKVEKKRQNLKFYGGFKGAIAIINNNYKNWEKV